MHCSYSVWRAVPSGVNARLLEMRVLMPQSAWALTSPAARELQAESGVSGGVCGNGTQQGDKGGILTVSGKEVREGLLEKVTLEHMYEYRE